CASQLSASNGRASLVCRQNGLIRAEHNRKSGRISTFAAGTALASKKAAGRTARIYEIIELICPWRMPVRLNKRPARNVTAALLTSLSLAVPVAAQTTASIVTRTNVALDLSKIAIDNFGRINS